MKKFKKFKKFEIKGDEILGGAFAASCSDMCHNIDNEDVWVNCMEFCHKHNR